jgi:hypothetical protein
MPTSAVGTKSPPFWRAEHAYVYLDGIWLKRSWGGEVRNLAVLVAIGVDQDGFRQVLGVMEGAKEDHGSWLKFLRHLKERGLKGVQLVISDKCLGLLEALGESYPQARWQRCAVHFYRNVFTVVPRGKFKEVAAMLKAIHAQEDRDSALAKAQAVVAKLEGMPLRMKQFRITRQELFVARTAFYFFVGDGPPFASRLHNKSRVISVVIHRRAHRKFKIEFAFVNRTVDFVVYDFRACMLHHLHAVDTVGS